MKITPLDIRRKEFKRSVRGYSDEEVDIFLDEVADEFERLFQENMELQDRAHRLDEQIEGHAQLKDALEKTLISAQLQSEEIKANALKEGELILRDAQLKARGIVNDSYGETQQVQQTLVQLKRLEEEFRFKFRSLLEGYLKLLDEAAISSTGAETAALTGPAAAADSSVPATPSEVQKGPAPSDKAPAAAPLAPSPPQEGAVASPKAPAPASEPSTSAEEGPRLAVTPEEEAPLEKREAVTPPALEVPPFRIAEESRQTAGEPAPADEVTAESPGTPSAQTPGQKGADESLRGFFFGRQMEDVDDTFPGEDELKKDTGRDFEW